VYKDSGGMMRLPMMGAGFLTAEGVTIIELDVVWA
jgi:hypothetical protein